MPKHTVLIRDTWKKGASAAQGRGTVEERSHVPSITQPWQEPAPHVRWQTEQQAELRKSQFPSPFLLWHPSEASDFYWLGLQGLKGYAGSWLAVTGLAHLGGFQVKAVGKGMKNLVRN